MDVTGILTGSDGLPMAGTVAAVAWPSQRLARAVSVGSAVPLTTLGWGVAGMDGSFSVRINHAKVPSSVVNANGWVNVELVGWNSSWQGIWDVPLQIGSSQPGQSAGQGAARSPGASAVHLVLGEQRGRAPSSVKTQSGVTPQIVCNIASWWLLDHTSTSLRFWTTLSGTYPYNTQTGAATFDATNTDVLGVAVSSSGSYGTWSVSGTNATSEGFGVQFGASTFYRYYQLESQYAKYGYGYGPSCGGGYSQYKVQPYVYTGGATTTSTTWKNYSNCVIAGANQTLTRSSSAGTAFSSSVGVNAASLLGINLSSQANYTTQHTVSYYFPVAAHWCGSNTTPGTAADTSGAP